jgi:hypothetical protein
MDREEIAWAAGVFEGEGSFTMSGHRRNSHTATVSMCDEDVVRRFYKAVGIGYVNGPYQNSGINRKPYYRWQTARFEHVQALVAMLWPWLGQRRRARAKEIFCGKRAA